MPLALSAGLNLYLTVFVAGLTVRLGAVENLPAGLDALGSWPVLAVAGVLFLLEFFADKIPYVDNVWDAFHTVIRPLGALVIALNVVPADDPGLAIAAALLAGGTALTSHSGKASLRAVVNTSPEPVSNSLVSLAEDAIVIAMVSFAIRFPITALAITLVLLVLIIWGLVMFVRWARRAFGGIREALRRGRKRQQPA